MAYSYSYNFSEFPGATKGDHFGRHIGNYSNGHFYFPFQIGYTWQKTEKKWMPTFLAGIQLAKVPEMDQSWGYRYSNGMIYDTHVSFRAQQPWTVYTFSLKASRTLSKGNLMYIGVNAHLSHELNDGDYVLNLPGDPQRGSFSDNGSHIALQIGYSLVRRHKKP